MSDTSFEVSSEANTPFEPPVSSENEDKISSINPSQRPSLLLNPSFKSDIYPLFPKCKIKRQITRIHSNKNLLFEANKLDNMISSALSPVNLESKRRKLPPITTVQSTNSTENNSQTAASNLEESESKDKDLDKEEETGNKRSKSMKKVTFVLPNKDDDDEDHKHVKIKKRPKVLSYKSSQKHDKQAETEEEKTPRFESEFQTKEIPALIFDEAESESISSKTAEAKPMESDETEVHLLPRKVRRLKLVHKEKKEQSGLENSTPKQAKMITKLNFEKLNTGEKIHEIKSDRPALGKIFENTSIINNLSLVNDIMTPKPLNSARNTVSTKNDNVQHVRFPSSLDPLEMYHRAQAAVSERGSVTPSSDYRSPRQGTQWRLDKLPLFNQNIFTQKLDPLMNTPNTQLILPKRQIVKAVIHNEYGSIKESIWRPRWAHPPL